MRERRGYDLSPNHRKDEVNHHSPMSAPLRKGNVQTVVTHRHQTAGFVVAWTDGSVYPNPGPGGWGYRIEGMGLEVEGAGGDATETTNNRMELTAILMAVRIVNRQLPVIIRTDSQLCMLCGMGLWRRKNNTDLWRELDVECDGRIVVYEWWRGHVGTVGNERADALAGQGRLDAIKAARAAQ